MTFGNPTFLYWAIPLVVGSALMLFVRRDRFRTPSSILALFFRVMILGTALFVAAQPEVERSAPRQVPILAFDAGAPLELKKEAREQGATQIDDSESIERWLIPIISREERTPFLHLWLEEKRALKAEALLAAAGVSHRVEHYRQTQDAEEVDASADHKRPKARKTGLKLSMPKSLHSNESFLLVVEGEFAPTSLTLTINSNVREFESESPRQARFEARLPAGDYFVEVSHREGQISRRYGRRLVVHETRAAIAVLSIKQATQERIRALLPSYDVFALNVDELPHLEALRETRALIVPLDEFPDISSSSSRELSRYARGGGLILTTGVSNPQLRSFKDAAITSELARLLPVHLSKPPMPKFTLPEEEPEPEEKEPEPNTEKKEVEATVGKVSMLFLVDHSGSMGMNNRWQQTTSALNGALERIKDFDRAGVMLFTDTTRWLVGEGISDVDSESAAKFRKALRANPPKQNAETRLAQAVKESVSLLEKEKSSVRVLVVLSDGIEEIPPGQDAPDYAAIRNLAIKHDITIVTLRVGAGGIDLSARKADERMKAMATSNDKAYAVTVDRENVLVPKIVLDSVIMAYRLYETKEADARREREEEELREAARKRREAERKAREKAAREAAKEMERARELEALEEAWREKEEALLIPLDHFLEGTQTLRMTSHARRLLRDTELPPFGGDIAKATLRDRGMILAQFEDQAIAMAYRNWGSGGVLYFAAPLSARHAGSWLAAPDQSAAALEDLIAGLSSPPASAFSILDGIVSDLGRITFRANQEALGGLEALGYDAEQQVYRLDIASHAGVAEVAMNSSIERIEIRDEKQKVLIAQPSFRPQLLPSPIAAEAHKQRDFGADEMPALPSPQTFQSLWQRQWLLILIGLLPIWLLGERFLRRA